jgi:hypothetical protein
MIKTIIRAGNDMVLVFNENGDEMPEYQGLYYDVKDKILADAQIEAVFKHWYGRSLRPVAVDMIGW